MQGKKETVIICMHGMALIFGIAIIIWHLYGGIVFIADFNESNSLLLLACDVGIF